MRNCSIVAISLFLASCTSLSSTQVTSGLPARSGGVAYSLPIRLVELNLARRELTPHDIERELVTARRNFVSTTTALATATATRNAKRTEARAARALYTALEATSSNRASRLRTAQLREAELAVAQAAFGRAQAAARSASARLEFLITLNSSDPDAAREAIEEASATAEALQAALSSRDQAVTQSEMLALNTRIEALSARLSALTSQNEELAGRVERIGDAISEADIALDVEDGERNVDAALEHIGAAEELLEALRNEVGSSEEGRQTLLTEEMRISLLPMMADPRHTYIADPRWGVFADTDLSMSIGSNNLLTSSNLTSDGRLDEIVTALSASVTAVQGGFITQSDATESFGGEAGEEKDDETTTVCECTVSVDQTNPFGAACSIPTMIGPNRSPEPLILRYDPTDTNDVSRTNRYLCEVGSRYRVSRAQIPVAGISSPARTGNPSRGLVYRTNQLHRFTVLRLRENLEPGPSRTQSDYVVQSEELIEIPNSSPAHVLRYRAGLIGEQQTNATFENGVLLSVDFDFENEIVEFAELPLEVVKGVATAVSQLVQLRIDLATKERTYVIAREDLAEALAAEENNVRTAELQSLQLALAAEQQATVSAAQLQSAIALEANTLREAELQSLQRILTLEEQIATLRNNIARLEAEADD